MPKTNKFKPGDRVMSLMFTAGDKEENQTGTVEWLTFDGQVVVKWDNGSPNNTYTGPDHLEIID